MAVPFDCLPKMGNTVSENLIRNYIDVDVTDKLHPYFDAVFPSLLIGETDARANRNVNGIP